MCRTLKGKLKILMLPRETCDSHTGSVHISLLLCNNYLSMPFSISPGIDKRTTVIRLLCFFWLLAKAISWKVWLAHRLFPVVPPFEFLFVPPAIHLLLFILCLAALLGLLIIPWNRLLQVSVIIVEVMSCSLDQNRWQPWEYEYIFIMLALLVNYKIEKNALSSIAFIFASIYFFSGISKMNPVFSISVRNEIAGSAIVHLHNSALNGWLAYHLGYALGAMESLLGIGLFFRRTAKVSSILLIIMHLLILAILGPFGADYDRIVWPWNIFMIIILFVFFIAGKPVSISFHSARYGWNKLIVILFGILPVLNFYGYWDFYLSSSLFSSRPPEMYICIQHAGSGKVLQPFFGGYKSKLLCDSTSSMINVRDWSFKEMQSPVYPEIRVYKSMKEQLLLRYPDMSATFIVNPYNNGVKKKIRLP